MVVLDDMPPSLALRFAIADYALMYGDGSGLPTGLIPRRAPPVSLPPETMTRQRRRARERRERKGKA